MRRFVWLPMAVALLAAFAVGGLLTSRGQEASAANEGRTFTPEARAAINDLKALSNGFTAIADAVIPSVVTITSERMIQPADSPLTQFNDPFFRRFFGESPTPRPFRQHGLGSGVVVESNGTILTNNHVIKGADALTVILSDGRRLEAKVLGADERTDLAVLKVDASGLPAMPFGDSDAVKTGEWVLAVGSPFSENLQATMTTGIVSGKGRSGMRLSEYEDFIQTDAAINPGNSGGALVNLDGELVGINSAIASRAGGFDGIGFAIPSNFAMEVMNDLVHKGRVSRGWLGVGIQNLTPELAQAMDLDVESGVVVTSVQKDSPGEKGGLEAQDVIVSLDGHDITNGDHLRMAVARTDPGKRVDLTVLRGGDRKTVHVVLGEFPDNPEPTAAGEEGSNREGLGLSVAPVTPELARQFEIEDARGLVVTAVDPSSPAEEAGIQPGDQIVSVNREKVDSVSGFRKAIGNTAKGKPVLLKLDRNGNAFFVALKEGD